MKNFPLMCAFLALASLCVAPLSAQSLSTNDDGSVGLAVAGPSGPSQQAPGSLTTTFVSNNQFAGNMFDITPTVDLELTGLDINCTIAGTTANIDVWYIPGTSFGNEASGIGWILIGNYNGTSAGQDLPTFMDMTGNGVTFAAGQTYGIYVDLTSYPTQALRYTNGTLGGDLFSNADVSLLTNAGNGSGGFGGSVFQTRNWNGTMYYETSGAGGPTLSVTGACPGPVTIDVSGATPLASVALVYGAGGAFTIPGGACAGLVLDIASPSVGAILSTGPGGDASASVTLPGAACGLTLQAVDLSGCVATNAVVL